MGLFNSKPQQPAPSPAAATAGASSTSSTSAPDAAAKWARAGRGSNVARYPLYNSEWTVESVASANATATANANANANGAAAPAAANGAGAGVAGANAATASNAAAAAAASTFVGVTLTFGDEENPYADRVPGPRPGPSAPVVSFADAVSTTAANTTAPAPAPPAGTKDAPPLSAAFPARYALVSTTAGELSPSGGAVEGVLRFDLSRAASDLARPSPWAGLHPAGPPSVYEYSGASRPQTNPHDSPAGRLRADVCAAYAAGGSYKFVGVDVAFKLTRDTAGTVKLQLTRSDNGLTVVLVRVQRQAPLQW